MIRKLVCPECGEEYAPDPSAGYIMCPPPCGNVFTMEEADKIMW